MALAMVMVSSTVPLHVFAAIKPGDKTVAQVCSVCHGAGLMGAPKIGDTNAWQGRLKKAGSIDSLAESAEHGKGNMPPRGGQSNLTDDDLKAAIHYMLDKSGVAS
jgi:cytochrome c5